MFGLSEFQTILYGILLCIIGIVIMILRMVWLMSHEHRVMSRVFEQELIPSHCPQCGENSVYMSLKHWCWCHNCNHEWKTKKE